MQSPKEIRTFRFNKSLLETLRISAKRHGLTENALAERTLTLALRADVIADTFGHVGFSRETFSSIMDAADSNLLVTAGAERGRQAFMLATESFESNGLQLGFIQFVSEILGEEAGWFRVEGATVKPERISLQHGFGLKWSEFLGSYVASAYQAVAQDKLGITTNREYVSIRFKDALPRY
jgi:hypothetical protein